MEQLAKQQVQVKKLSEIKIQPKFKQRSEDTTNKQHIPYLENTNPDVIFLGTSMFERFNYDEGAKKAFREQGLNEYNIGNLGVGGDRIENILYRILNLKILEYIKQCPKLIIIMAGANDVENKKLSSQDMFEGFHLITHICKLRFPEAKISVLGMFCRTSEKIQEEIIYQKVIEYNNLVKQIDNVNYQWFGDQLIQMKEFTNQKGIKINVGYKINKFYIDDVHFNYEGYSVFAKCLKDLIDQQLK